MRAMLVCFDVARRLVSGHSAVGGALQCRARWLSSDRRTDETTPPNDRQVSSEDSATFEGHIPEGELQISFSRSSGPGGQNVNKVNSKVEIRFHLETATWIPAAGGERLKTQWGHLVNRRGQLVLECDEQRSQLANTRICLDRLRSLVTEACRPPPSGPDEATQRLHEKRQARASARRVEEKRARSQWRRFKEPSRIL
ncbi:hypothetical protein MTO96_034864 [Rhipicephalus appendiculatus]